MENNTLTHWGIKGMRWGVRRYQNADGSLTSAGKKRQAKNLQKAREAAAKKREEKKALEEKRAKLLTSTDPKELYENRNLLTTMEINERINRIDTEARLGDRAMAGNRKTGEEYMQSGADKINKAINLYRSVDNAYSTVSNSAIGKTIAKKLGIEPPKKKFSLDEAISKMSTMTNQEVMDLNKRVISEKSILMEQERRKAETLKEAQRQVDEYNTREAYRSQSERQASTYYKSGSDILDSKLDTGRRMNDSSNNEVLAIGGPVLETLLLPGPTDDK